MVARYARLLALVLSMGGFVMTAATDATGGIDIYVRNRRYWQYEGRPVLLLGGSVEDNLFQVPDLARELDTLVAAGGNYVRCTMSSRDEGNVWPFKMVGEKYDLNQWNDEYWRRFDTFLRETERRGVIVQVEVWATFDFYRDNWDRNPFNPKNNVNYTAEESGLPTVVATHPTRTENSFFRSVPRAENLPVVLKYQERFVDRLVQSSLPYDHVLYCMDNETSVTPEWGAYWSRYVLAAAARLGKRVHTTEMWDPWDLSHAMHRATIDHPEIYSFIDVSQNNHQKGQVHYDNALRVYRCIARKPRPMNSVKVYGADGGRFGGTRDGVERFWRNIFCGFAAVRFHRPPSGLGLGDLAQRMIRAARQVTGAFDIFRCEPHPELLGRRAPNEAYCLAEPGRQYAVYFTSGGRVTLDLRASKGRLHARWFDIDAGEWREDADVDGGRSVPLQAPGPGQWAAVLTAE